jgi:glutamine synthetase
MAIDGDLAARARADDVSFLLALFVDLAGTPCANLVPVEAAEAFQADGVGFAGFAVGAIGQAPCGLSAVIAPTAARQRDEFLDWHAAVSPAEVDRYLTAF